MFTPLTIKTNKVMRHSFGLPRVKFRSNSSRYTLVGVTTNMLLFRDNNKVWSWMHEKVKGWSGNVNDSSYVSMGIMMARSFENWMKN
ncbi:hypothetical protein Leryth_003443 [Lithospermum erythrorhizon]|nr:hypothetical protein Leryth_003443 [Lithospermum erythrorhizon]